MTPQERALVTELFDRLATLENEPRDPDAERAIMDGLRHAPNAAYALVQTALVQDEALKRADARIHALEAQLGGAPTDRPTGFLDGMRDALLGRRETPRGSVPSVRPAREQPQEPEQPQEREQQPQGQSAANAPGAVAWRQGPAASGGSFLGTAAAAAAGVIGGSLLLDGIRSMMGPGHGAFGLADPAFGAGREPGSPWDNSGGGDLARQAGIDDIGRDTHTGGGGSGYGLFGDTAADDAADADQDVAAFDDSGTDFGGGDFGGSDA
ncbi:MAG TPA: DUF2076 domain-containing protein [Xanthobacteraceae bacterium]|nr:DUF2076 domain-containing protein [Xanthobacteraceae bacterium]